ncbi:MAG: class I SAM-dependent methyltransferase [Actinomycetota bacterium]|nr:class I SAM-dependent methyltransferase [Actinomycetota bacterium]
MYEFYPESRFGGFTDIDGTIAFYLRVNSLIDTSSVLLDVGCGRGAFSEDPILLRKGLRNFKGKCRKVIGIDIDENASANPFLDQFVYLKENAWPLENKSIDVCICDNVLEHFRNPEIFFSECNRVIKNGGFLCIRTPNTLNYIGVISRITPQKFHTAILQKVKHQIKEEDIFRTYYRCNTKRKLKRMLDQHGFLSYVYGYEAEPSYHSFSRLFYLFGVIHQRLAPNALKASIFAFAQKH